MKTQARQYVKDRIDRKKSMLQHLSKFPEFARMREDIREELQYLQYLLTLLERKPWWRRIGS